MSVINEEDIELSFVIPCYRSENTISMVVNEIISVVNKNNIKGYEIVLVNDCSPDGVWNVIKELSQEHSCVYGISLSKNFGQHAALLAGYGKARGAIVVSLDDDGQTPVDELPLLLSKIYEGFDVVYAYYDEIRQNAFRRFGSWMAEKMGQWMIGIPKGLKGSSYFAAKKYVTDKIVTYHNPYPYIGGLVIKVTRNVTNVLTHHRSRLEGASGYTFRKLLGLWVNGLTAFSIVPLRISTYTGILSAFAGFIYAAGIIVRKISNPAVAVGWSSTMAAILIMGGLILFMLGIVGEYIGRIYICINHTPQYVIKETTEGWYYRE